MPERQKRTDRIAKVYGILVAEGFPPNEATYRRAVARVDSGFSRPEHIGPTDG